VKILTKQKQQRPAIIRTKELEDIFKEDIAIPVSSGPADQRNYPRETDLIEGPGHYKRARAELRNMGYDRENHEY